MKARGLPIGRAAAAAAVAAVCALAVLVASAQAEPRTVRDGVFSAAQVKRGQQIFKTICVNCHEIEEFIGPGAYLEDHDGKTLWETFESITITRPKPAG